MVGAVYYYVYATQINPELADHIRQGMEAGFAGTLTPWPPLPHALARSSGDEAGFLYVGSGLFASYDENGTRKRWRGTAERFATEVPANAKGLEVNESVGRIETFITAGKPNDAALKPSNVGLELIPITHPNDLYAGEASKFRFLLDGKPAANLEVVVQAGGTRYRNEQQEQKLKTDANGELSVNWPNPGMYWLESVLQDQKTSVKQAKQRRVSYVATFEVLPQ